MSRRFKIDDNGELVEVSPKDIKAINADYTKADTPEFYWKGGSATGYYYTSICYVKCNKSLIRFDEVISNFVLHRTCPDCGTLNIHNN